MSTLSRPQYGAASRNSMSPRVMKRRVGEAALPYITRWSIPFSFRNDGK